MTTTMKNVIDYVRRSFGDEASVQITDEDIIRWTNAAQRELSSRNDILRGTATTDLVLDQTEYDLSSIPIQKIHSIYVNGIPIENRSFQHAEEYIIGHDPERTAQGVPRIWYRWGNTLHFWPKPDNHYANGMKIYYVAQPVEISLSTDVLSLPDGYFNRIVEYVLAQAYELDENFESSNLKLQQFGDGLNRMAGEHDRPQAEFYPTITILPEDMGY